MFRQCPKCGSLDVRHSSFQGGGALEYGLLFSPYRCRTCRVRFRVISKKFYGFVAVIGLGMLPPLFVYLFYLMVR